MGVGADSSPQALEAILHLPAYPIFLSPLGFMAFLSGLVPSEAP